MEESALRNRVESSGKKANPAGDFAGQVRSLGQTNPFENIFLQVMGFVSDLKNGQFSFVFAQNHTWHTVLKADEWLSHHPQK